MMHERIRMKSYGLTGPNFILIHGYGGTPRQWDAVAQQLSPNYQVHVLQLSPLFDPKKPLLFGVQVEILIQFLEKNFNSEPVLAAGISYGATLLWAAQIRRPDLFQQKFLINPLLPQAMSWMESSQLKFLLKIPFSQQTLNFLLSTPFGKSILRKSSELFRPGDQHFLKRIKKMDRRMIYYVSSMIVHFSWVMRNEDWNFWEENSVENGPEVIDLIVSDKDPLFGIKNYEDFYKNQLSHGRWNVIRGAGHLIQLSHPEKLCEIMNASIQFADSKKVGA